MLVRVPASGLQCRIMLSFRVMALLTYAISAPVDSQDMAGFM